MKSKLIKPHLKERKEVFNSRIGIVFNGEDNLKPLATESLIDGSPTAFQCAGLYQNFLAGAGFKNDPAINIGKSPWKKKTISDFAYDVAESIARHQGAFIHVQYNAAYEKVSYSLIPYTLMRVGEKDSSDYAGKYVMAKEGWKNRVKPEDRVDFNAYDPRPEVIQAQVDAAGGWANYKGQVLFFKMNDKYTYPLTLLDSCYLFADTEYRMSLFYQSTVTRGFKDIQLITHKSFEKQSDQRQFQSDIEELMGSENANSFLLMQDDGPQDDPHVRFTQLKTDEKPDRYAHFEKSAANYIRKAFRNVPPVLVDYVEGKLGETSGESLRMAQSIYNVSTAPDRNKIQELFKELFDRYKEPISSDFTIKQYSLTSDGTTEDSGELTEAEKAAIQAQAALKGSVGGVQALLQVQASVADGITTYDSGVATLMEMYGFAEPIAKRLLGEPKKEDDGTTDQ